MTKEELREYKWIQENIRELEDRLLEIDTHLQRITSSLDNERVQTTKDPDKWTNLINKRIEVQELINAEITNGYEEMARIEKLISGLDQRAKRLMRLRYIQCLTWEEIAVEMGYTWQHMHRIHAQCLKDIM